jgi:hypothetical protein
MIGNGGMDVCSVSFALRLIPTATRPEIAWFWSIIVMGPAHHQVKMDGRAPTLEQATDAMGV